MKTQLFCFLAIGFVSMAIAMTSTPRPTTRRTYVTSNRQLANISNQLYAADVNSAGNLVVLDLQSRTLSGNTSDRAPLPLFKNVSSELLNRPTYATMLNLYNNYVAAAQTAETVTAQEIAEENTFMNAVFNTDVMRKTYQFLRARGEITGSKADFKRQVKELWFGMYSRAKGKLGSSGFEHVFLGELKDGISGLHSWLRYYLEEKSGSMNYLGYIRTRSIGKNTLIEMPVSWRGEYKAFNSISVGTSPELEMALYTICFLTRPNGSCPVEANGVRYRIQSFTSNYNGKRFIGTTYPSL